jgi:myo-inositol-1(or 4)-monophosphatase
MNSSDISHLLQVAVDAVRDVAQKAFESRSANFALHHRFELDGREVKLDLDTEMSVALIAGLAPSGISIISEEAPHTHDAVDEYVWLIDPLDGSMNFLRGTGPSAVSCALLRGNDPIFGVVLDLSSGSVTWGGKGLGAFTNDSPIVATRVLSIDDAVVCTGVPARLNTDDPDAIAPLVFLLKRARKIRMIGSAAMSLLLVARGSADFYAEEAVMPWDVAAGLAIVEGAQGATWTSDISRSSPMAVAAGSAELVNAYRQERS